MREQEKQKAAHEFNAAASLNRRLRPRGSHSTFVDHSLEEFYSSLLSKLSQETVFCLQATPQEVAEPPVDLYDDRKPHLPVGFLSSVDTKGTP